MPSDIARTTMQDISATVASFYDGPAVFKTLYWQGIGYVPPADAMASMSTVQGM
jgi:hypothetical protein